MYGDEAKTARFPSGHVVPLVPPDRVGPPGSLAELVQRAEALREVAFKASTLAREVERALLGDRPEVAGRNAPPRPEPSSFAQRVEALLVDTIDALEMVHDALNRIQAAF
jgi:hypothetical protein